MDGAATLEKASNSASEAFSAWNAAAMPTSIRYGWNLGSGENLKSSVTSVRDPALLICACAAISIPTSTLGGAGLSGASFPVGAYSNVALVIASLTSSNWTNAGTSGDIRDIS
jgi:hypothetical protein